MNLSQKAEAEEIALVAIGLEPAKREAYLRRRTAGDPEVLADVRRRLELADRVPEGFLDRPALELLDAPRDAAPPGRPGRPS